MDAPAVVKRWLARLKEAVHDDSRLSPRFAPLVHPIRTVLLVYKALARDRAFEHAAAMSYTTLAALVPLLMLVFGVLDTVGVLERDPQALEELLFSSVLGGMPELRDVLVPGLQRVDLRTLGVVGVAGLALVAWRLYVMVEAVYSQIFGVPVTRSLRTRVLQFYMGLTVLPVLVATLLFQMTRTIGSWGGGTPVALAAVELLVLLGALRFFPNTKVRWGPALMGAGVSLVLLQVSHALFNWYLTVFAGADPVRVIYGSLAAIPMFLFWLWIVWVVVLVGVEVAAVAQNYRSMWEAEVESRFGERHPGDAAPHPGVDAVLLVLCTVAAAFEAGEAPLAPEQIAVRTGLTHKAVMAVLTALEARTVVLRAGDAGWVLAKPPSQVELAPLASSWRADQTPLREQTWTLRRIRADLDGALPETLAEGMQRWTGGADEGT